MSAHVPHTPLPTERDQFEVLCCFLLLLCCGLLLGCCSRRHCCCSRRIPVHSRHHILEGVPEDVCADDAGWVNGVVALVRFQLIEACEVVDGVTCGGA
jgi:hypothetical protein